ncbi:MAG: diacylglycerol kinase family protein [Phycisphaerae bacterium]
MSERGGNPSTGPGQGRSRRKVPRLETDVPYASPFTVMGRLRSFKHAVMGIWLVLRSQHNAWLHAVATVLALVLAGILHAVSRPLSLGEWADLVLAIVLVWVAETFNTGLEVMADGLVQERHPVIKIAKDVAAAAVLMAAVGAVAVGAILFIPRLVLVIQEALDQW